MNLNKIIKFAAGIITSIGFFFVASQALGIAYLPAVGGTGTSTPPQYGQVLVGNNHGTYDVVATTSLGISSSPAGSNTQIQFNDLGIFGASSGLTFDKNSNSFKVNGGTGLGVTAEIGGTIDANYYNASSFGQIIDNNASAHLHTLNLNSATPLMVAYFDGSGNLITIATSTLGIALGDTTGTLAPNRGGTGITSPPTYGQILVGNAVSGYTLTATSTLGLQSPITLTTTGTSGASTFSGNILNIPNYTTTGGSGSVATSTSEVAGQVPYFTSTAGTPALIGGSTNFIWDNTNGRLGIGTSTPYAKLSVVGNGYIGESGLPSASLGTIFNTYTTDLNSNVVANSFQAQGSLNAAGSVQALNFNVTDTGSNNVGTMQGVNGIAAKSGSGSLTSLIGVNASPRISGTVAATLMTGFNSQPRFNAAGASATTIVNFNAAAASTGGTVGSSYGVKVAAQKVTGVTTGYGFASDGTSDLNYFLGSTGVGTSTPGSLFSVGNTNGINFSTATSTFNSTGGINLISGCYAVGGACLTPGAGTVTSVNASGGTTGLSFSGGPITSSGTVTLAGVLNTTNGGTGTSTAPSYGKVLLGNSLGSYDLVSTSTLGIIQDLSGYELLSNKSTNTSLGTSNSLYPTQNAVKTYVDNAVIGLLDYRGSYDASTNLYPSTGGSGVLGAVLKGDFWIVSVPGTLGGTAVTNGDLVVALSDTPGQTSTNWDLIEHDLGYTPEDAANKVTSISGASTNTQYPSAKLLYDQLALKGSGTVTSVNVSGGTSGLTFSGGPITTSGSITLGGTLIVANGGTGSTTLSGILKGNGTSAIASATNGTDYTLITAKTCTSGDFVSSVTAGGIFTCTTPAGATYLAGTGLTLTGGNTFNVNTSQNISTLSNLPTNGFVKTSGGTGALSVDTTSYQTAGNYITALTGDVTASGPGSVAATLATVNANTGSFGSSTAIPNFTTNAKGLLTAAGTNVVIAPAGTLTGTTLASNVVSSSLTSVGTIATGVWSGTAIGVTKGGTGLTAAPTYGQVLVGNAGGTYDQVATSSLNITAASTASSSPKYYTAGATWTKQPGLRYISLETQAAGGNGGGCSVAGSASGAGGGGGGGGYGQKVIAASLLGSTETITIGAVGSNTSFGTWIIATPGSNGADEGVGGTGGTASGIGDLNILPGGDGGTGSIEGTTRRLTAPSGGTSRLGGAGRGGLGQTSTANAGANGKNYGGGGGGASCDNSVSASGGNGAPAEVIVTEMY